MINDERNLDMKTNNIRTKKEEVATKIECFVWEG